MDATPRPTATRGTRPAEAPRTTFVVRGSGSLARAAPPAPRRDYGTLYGSSIMAKHAHRSPSCIDRPRLPDGILIY